MDKMSNITFLGILTDGRPTEEEFDRPTDRPTDRLRIDRRIDRWTGGWTDLLTDQRNNTPVFRSGDASDELSNKKERKKKEVKKKRKESKKKKSQSQDSALEDVRNSQLGLARTHQTVSVGALQMILARRLGPQPTAAHSHRLQNRQSPQLLHHFSIMAIV